MEQLEPVSESIHGKDSNHQSARWLRALAAAELGDGQSRVVSLGGQTIVLFNAQGRLFAVDNRCPHMGFPLDRGTIKDCILTCHWHHARFDLESGGTFDQWADDVRVFPVKVEDGAILVDVAERGGRRERALSRLSDGLERDIPLVIAKSVLALLEEGGDPRAALRAGLEFGVSNRRDGWGSGLTTLTCLANLASALHPEDRAHALYHGLAAVARDTDGNPPRFAVRPLPGRGADPATLKRWFRSFVEVRDSEGAERCITSAVELGASSAQLADMMFAAATDHRYLTGGHVLDFTNKAFEALDHGAGDLSAKVLASLARSYAMGERMEESNQWRNPVDLVAICETAFEKLPPAVAAGRNAGSRSWSGRETLAAIVLGDDPQEIADAMLAALREGATPAELSGAVAYAAALRIARFHTSNEFGDWDTAHHSFTFANAVHEATLRAPSAELVRGTFDAAMSVYLNRFLNVPAAKIPASNGSAQPTAQELLHSLLPLLDRQQQVDGVTALTAGYFARGGEPAALVAELGRALLREDRDFHSIQDFEAAVRVGWHLGATPAAAHVLIATARYLAAHSPTVRAQGQTWKIASRLYRGEKLFEE
ncbi:MAG TPA: Rieske 2Fe-2S domain-containing protein [Candidatus Binataceae bacterium]|nr:Rieske 2Fe-2S domain-containing protein [Candidatus Binataceae bacterium]